MGGLLAQLPILVGSGDISHTVTGNLESDNVFVNGVMTPLKVAEDGAEMLAGEDSQTWHNPTHGGVSDGLEFFADKIYSGVRETVDKVTGKEFQIGTGITRQIADLQDTSKGGAAEGRSYNINMHSQGNDITALGANEAHNYNSYGAPVRNTRLEEIFDFGVKRNFLVRKTLVILLPAPKRWSSHQPSGLKPYRVTRLKVTRNESGEQTVNKIKLTIMLTVIFSLTACSGNTPWLGANRVRAYSSDYVERWYLNPQYDESDLPPVGIARYAAADEIKSMYTVRYYVDDNKDALEEIPREQMWTKVGALKGKGGLREKEEVYIKTSSFMRKKTVNI